VRRLDDRVDVAHHRPDVPVEPPASSFPFPPVTTADERGRVAVGGDLEPGTLLAAYRSGLFPLHGKGEMTWWSPDPRAVLLPGDLRVSHSLRRSIHRYETTIDMAFQQVMEGCADRAVGEYHWITEEIRSAYFRLHQLGWAHSVETWSRAEPGEPRELVGGLYGVAIGGMFGGESMFHRKPDASKVALVRLVEVLRDGADPAEGEDRLIDVQWITPHLASLGGVEITRAEYLERLERAIAMPLPTAFAAAAVAGLDGSSHRPDP
jgi:leucyl/phenylalanyl-tRNA--protein transferase